jgi:hypothetical protein
MRMFFLLPLDGGRRSPQSTQKSSEPMAAMANCAKNG